MSEQIMLAATCPFCGKETQLKVEKYRYEEWKTGNKLVQNIFPYMRPADRELLITGICYRCQGETFDG